MTTFFNQELVCPVCGTVFQTQVLGSANQFDLATDLKPLTMGVPYYMFVVHTCPECFFSGTVEEFECGIEAATADRIRQEMEFWRRKLGPVEPTPAHSYMLAGFCALVMAKPPHIVADLFLAASWCADDDSMPEFADELRKEALTHFQTALNSPQLPDRERARVCYIIGELLRRLGREKEAHEFFKRVKLEVVDPAEQEWLIKGAERQMREPADRFGEFLRGNGFGP